MAGGSGGVNSWPDYMQYTHWWWLSDEKPDSAASRAVANTFNMDDDLTTARANNPYTGKAAYNPTVQVEQVELGVQGYRDAVGDLAPSTDFASDMDIATAELLTAVEVVAPEDPDIEDDVEAAVTAYEDKITPELMRSIGRFAAGMQEAGALNTTQFTFGLADLEKAHLDKVGEFRGQVRGKLAETRFQFKLQRDLKEMELSATVGLENNRQQYAFLIGGAELLSKMRLARLSAISDKARLEGDLAKVGIAAYKEQNDMDIALDVKSKTYNLDLYAYGGNLLAAVSGGVYRTAGEVSDLQKFLSTATGALGVAGDAWDLYKSLFGGDSNTA